jgi:hypothetical protein
MSQNDFNLANQGFPSMRSDINSALQALASNSSGATAPTTTYAYQFWYDSTTNILKMRNAANSAWINIFTFDQANNNWSADAKNLTRDGSQVFSRNNILATVTQSAGVPTGGIIERGAVSPTNRGQYIRYADGTQICWSYNAGDLASSSASGNVFRTTTEVTWTFPVAFIEAPVVTVSTDIVSRWSAVGAVTSTTVDFRHFSAVTAASTVATKIVAVGRWF